MPQKDIVIKGAKDNNLKSVSLSIPRDKLIVFTGVSGSGKSSLAFDTIYAEGQRRYIESLSSYARLFLGQAEKPNVELIDGLSPTISIDQKTTSHNPRSTVGTITEIYDYLRLLYSRIGVAHCYVCGKEIHHQTIDQMVDQIFVVAADKKIQIMAPLVKGEKGTHKTILSDAQKSGYIRVRIDGRIFDLDEEIKLEKNKKHTVEIIIDRLVARNDLRPRITEALEHAFNLKTSSVVISIMDEVDYHDISFAKDYACPEHNVCIEKLEPRMFSFNNPFGACPDCTGLGSLLKVAPDMIIPNKALSINEGAIKASGWVFATGGMANTYFEGLAKHLGFSLNVPVSELSPEVVNAILYGTKEKIPFYRQIGGNLIPFVGKFEGVINNIERRFKESTSDLVKDELRKYMREVSCPTCKGARLKNEVLAVTVCGKNIGEFCDMSVKESLLFMDELKLASKDLLIADRIIKEIKSRLTFLQNVGLSYLTLARSAATISGGESQRLRLATQIGAGLVGVIYILDEPSIGLHPRDNDKLIAALKNLRDIGNTVIVVEHDEETMYAADHIVDIGPGAGVNGGEIVCQGTIEEIKACKDSLTGSYLSGTKKIPIPATRRSGNGKHIKIWGASENNLKNIDVSIPLGKFVAITGVSGSGKSTLINGILYKALYSALNKYDISPGKHKKIEGLSNIKKIVNIDQSPIGRTPRSNPATYTGTFTDIRALFAETVDAKTKGYGMGRFSFNVSGGRCEACSGDGIIKIEMHFLPDVFIPCEVCLGKRYNQETLTVRYKNKNIYDVLEMTVEEALSFFENIPKIKRKMQCLFDVGLGYIKLGQPATTLSGGEAQRVKLATELSKHFTDLNLYLLDEPTTGLHVADVDRLITVLHKLVDSGATVLTIEHNLDVIKNADYIIDLGLEGGDLGGNVICQGTPEKIAECGFSYTGQYLKKYLT
ncbi:excinuclease ABC subunit A [Clostridia bacterium]|nr:excinuclease ABC subunit A [Clostridia bacterium]